MYRDKKVTSPRKIAERTTEKKGSIALMVCVNDTATFPRLMLVKRLPIVWTIARGRMATSWKKKRNQILMLIQMMNSLKFVTQIKSVYLCSRNLWSLQNTRDPHKSSNCSSNSKLNFCNVYGVRENLENLSYSNNKKKFQFIFMDIDKSSILSKKKHSKLAITIH